LSWTALRAARERPGVFILALTSNLNTALRHLLLWGGHCIHSRDVSSISEMVESVVTVIQHCALGKTAERVVIFAGIPFPTPGATNALHIVRLG
jgi:pyruvate kinase